MTGAGALERVIRRGVTHRSEATERCDLCRAPVPGDHAHLLDLDSGDLVCACRPCGLLFDRDAAGSGRYRQVPRRRKRIAPVRTDALGVPVGLAFFVVRSDGTVLAHYPSPAGPTQWEVDPEPWQRVLEASPALRDLAPDVEALMINTARGRQDYWLVPIDDCFRLVAVVRRSWKGLSGGSEVWPAIDRFFDALDQRQ